MEVELKGITKRFGPVIANSNVNLTIRPGEVLGLLGENGAGKSTMMNILSGLYSPDEGEILFDGKKTDFDGPGQAIAAGIGMVHQHFMLVPVFSVAENVILGVEPTGPLDHLDLKTARAEVRRISDEYGLEVDPDALVEELPVGIRQRVEILKVLFRSADVIIFDEPTAVLTPQEVDGFFKIVKALRKAGKALVFITHKLHEILEIADCIAVLRGGKITGTGDPKSLSEQQLAEMMVGRAVNLKLDKKPYKPGPTILQANGLTLLGDNDEAIVSDADFHIRSGEIVGIAGVQGNGQTELIQALNGLRPIADGVVRYKDHDITHMSARQRHRIGIAHIPEDRLAAAMIGDFTIAENMVLNAYHDRAFSSGPVMNWPAINRHAAELAVDFDVRTPSVFLTGNSLSGGNQQKMVAAREMSRNPALLIAAQPTRGVDVGSIEYLHGRILAARDDGNGVLIVSSELDEILALSDRIYVMFHGRIVAEFGEGTQKPIKNDIGLAMAGVIGNHAKKTARKGTRQ